MAATDPITDLATARTLIETNTRFNVDPVLSVAEIDLLVSMATSKNDADADQWTVADLNRVVSLGWTWKLATATQEIKVGVGPGKTFESQLVFDHCEKMAAAFANGSLSVVGSANGATGMRRSGSGSVQLVTPLTTTTT